MIFAEESSRPKDRGCLRFKCSSFYELNAVNTLPVHDLGAVNDYILRFKYSSTAGQSDGVSRIRLREPSSGRHVAASAVPRQSDRHRRR